MDIDASLARRLVGTRFPEWADLTVTPIEPDGWDNRTFRLGERMSVRLPSAAAYAPQVDKEHRWLPKLAPLLTLAVPVPLAMGQPAHGYPWRWSVYPWLEGETAAVERIVDLPRFAADLAGFLTALRRIDVAGGPPAGPHNFFRGGPLTVYDGETRQAILALGRRIDADAATAVWETALAATWGGPPVWVHGDVGSGNLLVGGGRLAAVIDFGMLGVGDPACDTAVAWTLFEGQSREAFRAALRVDDGTWARGRGWVLWKSLIVLAGLSGTNPIEAGRSLRALGEVLADHCSP